MNYVELCCKTNFSFLEAASHPHEFIEEALRLGLYGMAITDRDGFYGMPKAYSASKDHAQFRFLVGCEMSFRDHPRLIFLAKDRTGYGFLSYLLTKGSAGLSWQQFLSFQRKENESLVVIAEDPLFEGKETKFETLRDIFGSRFYLPLSRFLDGFDQKRTQEVFELAKKYHLKIVATNRPLYHTGSRQVVQDLLTAIREKTPIAKLGTKALRNRERYLKSPQEMAKLFSDVPETLRETIAIAESCTFSPKELRYRYPSEWIPEGHDAKTYLHELTWKGAREHYPQGIPDAVCLQIEHELQLIRELEFADYFLTLWEIVAFARQKKILCQGRGSAANSIICYCLGITAIDPVRMNLLFERFISAERGEPPDIDVDFEHERREEVIQHIYEKYGRHRAAMVSAVITYRKRLALRDVTRALEIPYEDYAKAPKESSLRKKVETLAGLLEGFPRHLSIHSGGFTLSREPLHEIVPIEPARMPGRTIVQWDKYDLDILGLLKVDILSLGALSAIRKALDKTGLTLQTIPADDEKTFEMIRRGDSIGLFQLESRAQINMAQRLLPKNYYDLVIQIALVRPGPIVGKMVHPYLRRRHGTEKAEIPDPRLVPILGRTLGIPLFQEQVMKMAVTLADFTPGEADQLRRAIGAWRSNGSIEAVGQKLRQGLLKNGLPLDYVDLIFEQIKGFSEYGFPESHAASFAILAYASAYLKCHFPAVFTCALINSQPLGFYAVHTLVEDAKRHGVTILAVHPQESDWDCEVKEQNQLRLGLRVVAGIHRQEAERIIQERQVKPFRDLGDFMARTQLRQSLLEKLAMADFFSGFGYSQREALWEILRISSYLMRQTNQLSLFQSLPSGPGDPLFAPLPLYQAVCEDYASYGLSVKAHPMAALRQEFKRLGKKFQFPTAQEAKTYAHGRWVKVCGMVIVRQKPQTAKGAVFASFEDETGILDLMLQPKIYEKFKEVFQQNAFLIASGELQTDRKAVNLIVRHLQPLFETETPLFHAHEWC